MKSAKRLKNFVAKIQLQNEKLGVDNVVEDSGCENGQSVSRRVFVPIGTVLGIAVILALVVHILLKCPPTTSCQNVLVENWPAVFILFSVLTLAVFITLVYMGYLADSSLSRGEMRRAIAGTFVAGLQMLLVLSLIFKVYEEKVITAYLTAMTMILGFYFGSRSVQQTQQGASGLSIENVFFGKNEKKKVVISVRNSTPRDVSVDVIYINDSPKSPEKEVRIAPGDVKHVRVEFDWKEGETYELRVGSKEGYQAEVKKKAPGGKHGEA